MNLRAILKRDIQHRKLQISADKALIEQWKHELAALSTPLPRQGIDYAYGTPDLGRLKAAGVTFVCRYLGGDPGKDLTRAEAELLSHAGFDLVTVFESSAQGALRGSAGGYADAKVAVSELHRIGAPHAPVYLACDWDVQPSQMPAVRAYFKGATQCLGHNRAGVYGGYAVVHELMSLDNVKYGWQTYAWSQGRWSPHAQLRQVQNGVKLAGVECDLDRALAADFGQWRRT
jgi:Rv2525c-like, glycoside hydrolase-like domain